MDNVFVRDECGYDVPVDELEKVGLIYDTKNMFAGIPVGVEKFTSRLFDKASGITEALKGRLLGSVLIGSVAYAPFYDVREYSDLDMLLVAERKDIVDVMRSGVVMDEDDKDIPQASRLFEDGLIDAYSCKNERDGVKVNAHILSGDAFWNVCYDQDGKTRLFRHTVRGRDYVYFSLDGHITKLPQEYESVDGRTISVMPNMPNDAERQYIGIYVDKLLSNGKALYDKSGMIGSGLDDLLRRVVRDAQQHLLFDMSAFMRSLMRHRRFSPETVAELRARGRWVA